MPSTTPRSPSREPLLAPDSRPHSRPRSVRGHSATNSIPTLPVPEDIIVPGATALTEEEVELIEEIVHPHAHHATEATLVGEGSGAEDAVEHDRDWIQKRPWWRRPSPWWFLAYIPFAALAMTITAAAKIELFTYLVCQSHQPVLSPDQGEDMLSVVARSAASLFSEPSQRACGQDREVAAGVARLTMVMTTSAGILTCLTTAWWGSLSDRLGRTRVLGFAVVGILVQDLTFLSVFWFYKYIPGGYWFLLIGPIFEGALGGRPLLHATTSAYFADITPAHLRSGLFALDMGLLFTGVAVGPALGGLIIRFTGNFIIVFYISAAIHVVYALLVWFVIPESLSPADKQDARARHKLDMEEYRASHAHGGLLVFLKRVFGFLTPLALFFPIDLNKGGNPAKGKRRDWSLFFIAIAYACVHSLMGMYLNIIQYLSVVFGWNTEQVNYWFSSLGIARASFLTLVLPVVIRYFKPKPIRLPSEPDEPLSPTAEDGATSRSRSRRRDASSARNAYNTAKFDLRLARASVAADALIYVLMIFSTSGLMFAVITACGAVGMGFGPAMNAVALTLYARRGGQDTGKLFGSLSVLNALSAQVFGPFAYGLTFAKTLATFPSAIFVVAVVVLTLAFVLMSCVRLPDAEHTNDVEEQQPLVSEDADADLRDDRRDTLVGMPEPLIVVEDVDGTGPKVVKP